MSVDVNGNAACRICGGLIRRMGHGDRWVHLFLPAAEHEGEPR